jgi:outer membrane protein
MIIIHGEKMKKLLTTLALGATLATTLSADIARVEMGGGLWNETASGTLVYTDNGGTITYTSDEKENSAAYAWLLIKHPIPVIPNIRLEYSTMADTGVIRGSVAGYTIPGGLNASTTASVDITQYEVIPYYNLLDNTFWMTLDVGVDFRLLTLDYTADGVDIVGGATDTSYSDTTSLVIPMGYARTRIEIPTTDIGIEADVKYLTYNGSTVSDIRVKLDYTLDLGLPIDPGFEVGYRVQKFDLTSEDDTTLIKMDYTGVYAGIMLRF